MDDPTVAARAQRCSRRSGRWQEQRDAVIVVGAQAILLRGGRAHVTIAESTKHTDLVVDPRGLSLLFC